MIVYCYLSIDPSSVPPDYVDSEDYQVLLSRFLYVDLDGPGLAFLSRYAA